MPDIGDSGNRMAIGLLIFTAPKPFHWPLGLVLICLGFTVPVFIPASVALIIFWRKPETRDHFRMLIEKTFILFAVSYAREK